MSKQIDTTKRLSKFDRQYLEARGLPTGDEVVEEVEHDPFSGDVRTPLDDGSTAAPAAGVNTDGDAKS